MRTFCRFKWCTLSFRSQCYGRWNLSSRLGCGFSLPDYAYRAVRMEQCTCKKRVSTLPLIMFIFYIQKKKKLQCIYQHLNCSFHNNDVPSTRCGYPWLDPVSLQPLQLTMTNDAGDTCPVDVTCSVVREREILIHVLAGSE